MLLDFLFYVLSRVLSGIFVSRQLGYIEAAKYLTCRVDIM